MASYRQSDMKMDVELVHRFGTGFGVNKDIRVPSIDFKTIPRVGKKPQ